VRFLAENREAGRRGERGVCWAGATRHEPSMYQRDRSPRVSAADQQPEQTTHRPNKHAHSPHHAHEFVGRARLPPTAHVTSRSADRRSSPRVAQSRSLSTRRAQPFVPYTRRTRKAVHSTTFAHSPTHSTLQNPTTNTPVELGLWRSSSEHRSGAYFLYVHRDGQIRPHGCSANPHATILPTRFRGGPRKRDPQGAPKRSANEARIQDRRAP
jgi:hypothetical protein